MKAVITLNSDCAPGAADGDLIEEEMMEENMTTIL
jgi:hypothetical protein